MKINKNIKILLAVVVIILVFIGGYYLKVYMDNQKRANDANQYKKGFYEGLVCEYGCPMSLQTLAINGTNKTQILPSLDCVKGCTGAFKTKFAGSSFTKAELAKDNLLNDIDLVVNDCKKKSMNMTALKLDNEAYFKCAEQAMLSLKQNYTYLNN
jgi:hypothetical protein